MIGKNDGDTICAVSTPPGVGGISVIRLSGRDALVILRKAAPFLPESPESHRAYFGVLRDPSDRTVLDEVLITWFDRGRSFTGEETAEISCHGNPSICRDILETLMSCGARAAERGEFTYRAFMNQRMDLVQAESVLALIESRSEMARRLALRQLRGDLSRRLEAIENDVIWALAHIEAGIDFSTEGLEVVDPSVLYEHLEKVHIQLNDLVRSFKQGRILREGLKIALVGRPNVGKSSLLNAFLEEDRAIVTDIAGTTRDVVEGETRLNGLSLVFLDTAGLRETDDRIERLGIERSLDAAREADLVFFVFDASLGWTAEDAVLFDELDRTKTLVLGNKSDLLEERRRADLKGPSDDLLLVSSFDRDARKRVLESLSGRFVDELAESSAVVSSARHHERLTFASSRLEGALSEVRAGVGFEFIALGLKESLFAIQDVLGKRFDDQILDRVFKEFCIGK